MESPPSTDAHKGFNFVFCTDFGGVLVKPTNDVDCKKRRGGKKPTPWWETTDSATPNMLEALTEIVQLIGPQNVHIVSRATKEQREHTMGWLGLIKFWKQTGINPDTNPHFCSEVSGLKGKGPIAKVLGATHFVDDRAEALLSVWEDKVGCAGPNGASTVRRMFHFNHEAIGFDHQLPSKLHGVGCVQAVSCWSDILEDFRHEIGLHGASEDASALVPPAKFQTASVPWHDAAAARPSPQRNIRVQFVSDFGKRVTKPAVIKPDYDVIMQEAKLKLNPKKSKSEYYLVLRDKAGSRELTASLVMQGLLTDGSVIALTTERPMSIPPPPRMFAFETSSPALPETDEALQSDEGGDEVLDPGADAGVRGTPGRRSCGDADTATADKIPSDLALWPQLHGDMRPLLRQAIGGTPGFVERHMGHYISFDYATESASQLASMFPDPYTLPCGSDTRLQAAVRRECRGLLVCPTTGCVLARRLPKFFCVDELAETQFERLPTEGGIATIKHDGSLVSPFMLDGKLRWAGKAEIVPELEAFVAQRPSLAEAAARLVEDGVTPIFEWCPAGPPVGVISHSESRLVLIAARDIATGDFVADAKLRDMNLTCEVAEAVGFDTLEQLLEHVRGMSGTEGVVAHWPEYGKHVKIKSTWWTDLDTARRHGGKDPAAALSRALRTLALDVLPEREVWRAVLGGGDDQMALVYGQLAADAETTLRAFASNAEHGIRVLCNELVEWAEHAQAVGPDVELGSAAGGWSTGVLSAYLRRAPNAQQELRKFLTKLATAGRVNELESLLDTKWSPQTEPRADVHLSEDIRADVSDTWCDTYDGGGTACPQGASDRPELVFTIGAPGSGKTTWAEHHYPAESIIAADQWFDRFNGGKYNPMRIAEAHEWCQDTAREMLRAGKTVVVNNTNSMLSEMYPYAECVASAETSHQVKFAIMRCNDADILVKRSVHQVSGGAIKKMLHSIKKMGVPTMQRVSLSGPPENESLNDAERSHKNSNNKNTTKQSKRKKQNSTTQA